jgi:hypothetical protein
MAVWILLRGQKTEISFFTIKVASNGEPRWSRIRETGGLEEIAAAPHLLAPHALPIESKPCEILPQAIRVIRLLLALP